MSQFTAPLLVTPLTDGKSWMIVSNFGYDVGSENSGDTVQVTNGFVTDFASVPRVLWWALPKWGIYGKAAIIHDWLYWDQSRSRAQADAIMLEAMAVLNVPLVRKRLIYRAVRTFGSMAWKRNKWDKEAGLNRVANDADTAFSVTVNRPGIFARSLEQLRI
jgi:hypothetical protein